MSVTFRDRKTGRIEEEPIYGGKALRYLYRDSFFPRFLRTLLCKSSIASKVVGFWQSLRWTKGKIKPFIERFHIDTSEFLEPVSAFSSFNDFFIRKLTLQARPIARDKEIAVIPADGRFRGIQNVKKSDGFIVKGEKFTLNDLLQDDDLAKRYENGTMVMGRLCPTDYHRFHFPLSGTPSGAQLINGYLFSVSPIALKKNCRIFTENKRYYTILQTEEFGEVILMEIGATCVGTVTQTYTPYKPVVKGSEKGYFSFGGSAVILLFEPNRIELEKDLSETDSDKIELRCLMSQPMGRAIH